MAKKKEPEPQPSAGGQRMPGRLIASWKQRILDVMPDATDQEVAEEWNKQSATEGYNYQVDAAKVKQWRQERGKPKAIEARPPEHSDRSIRSDRIGQAESEGGEATNVLKDLVRLLGKDGAKRLIDSM